MKSAAAISVGVDAQSLLSLRDTSQLTFSLDILQSHVNPIDAEYEGTFWMKSQNDELNSEESDKRFADHIWEIFDNEMSHRFRSYFIPEFVSYSFERSAETCRKTLNVELDREVYESVSFEIGDPRRSSSGQFLNAVLKQCHSLLPPDVVKFTKYQVRLCPNCSPNAQILFNPETNNPIIILNEWVVFQSSTLFCAYQDILFNNNDGKLSVEYNVLYDNFLSIAG